MYNTNHKTSKEAWAVLDKNNEIVWTRGGSSTSPKIMIYESEKKALRALKNQWIKQIHDEEELKVIQIFKSNDKT